VKGFPLLNDQPANLIQIDQLELVCRLLEDDESALADVLTHFGGAIKRFVVAKYHSFNEHDADDVLSIGIRKLWESRDQYNEAAGSLRAYFFKICVNAASDIFKCGWAEARRLPVDFGEDNEVDLIPDDPPPADEKKRVRRDREKKQKKELEDLMSVIDELPSKEGRIVLADAQAKDRVADSDWLADELGIGQGSVRVYRHRAWKTIRAKMKTLGYELPPEGDADGK
jgi:RNA polymerase sigma factor (sigma-70 family)